MHDGERGVRKLQTCAAHTPELPAARPSHTLELLAARPSHTPELPAAHPSERPGGSKRCCHPEPSPSTPIPTPAVTWSRKRCAALSMVSRAAFCLCRARTAEARAVRRLDQRRAKAAATKQQARAAPETPESAAHGSSSTMISRRRPLPRATDEGGISDLGLRRKTRPGSPQDPAPACAGVEAGAVEPLGQALLPGSQLKTGGAQRSRRRTAVPLGRLPKF